MAWQDAINCFTKKKLSKESQEMESAGIKPIVLRWKRAIRGYGTGYQEVHGFLGCKTDTLERLDGQMEFSARTTPDVLVTFFPDEFNIGWALVPRCERNMNILAATMNDADLPWIIESPESIEEIKALAKKLNGTQTQKKAVKEKPTAADTTIEDLVASASV